MSPKSGNARAPLAVRVAMVVIAVVMAAATAWAAINLYSAVPRRTPRIWRCCASGSNRSMTN